MVSFTMQPVNGKPATLPGQAGPRWWTGKAAATGTDLLAFTYYAAGPRVSALLATSYCSFAQKNPFHKSQQESEHPVCACVHVLFVSCAGELGNFITSRPV